MFQKIQLIVIWKYSCVHTPKKHRKEKAEVRHIGAKVDDTLVKVRTLGFVDMLQMNEIYREVKNMEEIFETTLNCQKGKNETEKIDESNP